MRKIFTVFLFLTLTKVCLAEDPMHVGWLGAMSGSTAKYASYQAAMIAEEDINATGGINGKALKLIYEDGKGSGIAAVQAIHKLLSVDNVSFVIGGHCTPESLPIAPIVQAHGAVMLAAITSSPKLTDAGDNIFRVSAISTTGVDLVTKYAIDEEKYNKYAIIYEQTDYVLPLVERFTKNITTPGRAVIFSEGYLPGEADFRSLLLRLKMKRPDVLYMAVQSPDAAILIYKQMQEVGLTLPVLGNEITGNAVQVAQNQALLFNGLVFAEPEFDLDTPQVRHLVERFKSKFGTDGLPYGFWTAEAYDAVMLLADVLKRCGEEISCVKKCLYETRNYRGASGMITINEHGDGIRHYLLKKVQRGRVVTIR